VAGQVYNCPESTYIAEPPFVSYFSMTPKAAATGITGARALGVFGGEEYGTGSSRDWAAKGTQMLGIKVVVARGYERIHRSNLVGMGVLPCQFKGSDSVQSLKIDGTETFDLIGVAGGNVKPMQDVTLVIHRKDGSTQNVTVTLRVDSPIEVEYLKHGGILPYVLRELMAA
jgi:aconitate hydratase